MCLMLYLATTLDQPSKDSPELRVEEVEKARESVRQWFSLPTVRFIGAHTGCSCGFPSIACEEPVEYFEGMFSADPNHDANLRSLRSLVALVCEHVRASGEVELYAVWNGEEHLAPKRTVDVPIGALDPERFFFIERFLYRITRG